MIVEDIALTLVPGLNAKKIIDLLEIFSSSARIFGSSREELMHFTHLGRSTIEAIATKSTLAAAQREVEYCAKNDIAILASYDPQYPQLLRHANDFPHVIYVRGNLKALNRQNVSIIGTRRISSYGDRMTHDIVKGLSEQVDNLSIISGLAFGVDSAAHRAALAYGVTTVAVIANPLPGVTPTQHTALAAEIIERGGAIVSECHSQTQYRPQLYIARNRIIAAMSEVTVVAESPKTGGSMITANIASGYGRLVMAVPGRLTDKNSEGCNSLINNNVAQIFISPQQLVRTLMWDISAPADRAVSQTLSMSLTAPQQAIVNCFKGGDILSVEELCMLTQTPVNELSATLLEMEMEGLVRMLHGSRCELLNVIRTL